MPGGTRLSRYWPALFVALALVAAAGLNEQAWAEDDAPRPLPVVVVDDVEPAAAAEDAAPTHADDLAVALRGDPDACAQLAVDTYNMCRKFSSMLECAILAVSVEGWCLML